MIEVETGLPIGHHGLACDHAPAGGMMCWEIREAAVHFYDRNCRDCTLHEPVRVPNILPWIAERDAALNKKRIAEEAAAQEYATRLAARMVERKILRSTLNVIAADVLEQIGELDAHSNVDLEKRFVETARLAPEAFPAPVLHYLFRLIESRERWFDEPGLRALVALNADPHRLARCAMLALQDGSATRTAAVILTRCRRFADPSLIRSVLPCLIDLAAPDRMRGPLGDYRRPRIAPLVRLTRDFPDEVRKTLEALLSQDPGSAGLACRVVSIVVQRSPEVVMTLARDIVSKLVRAQWMPDPEDHGHDITDIAAHEIRSAVVEMFHYAPDNIDELLKSFRLGASNAGETRIASIYGRVLSSNRFRRFRQPRPLGVADRLAFRRLLWEAPETKSDEVLREIQRAIGADPQDLIELARDEVDHLIGAAILMDERLVAFDAKGLGENPTTLGILERQNRRQTLYSLRGNFIGWAAAGAAAAGKPRAYLDVLDGLPDSRDNFAASLIEHSTALADTADGLNVVLPSLYAALVGASVHRRGAAIHALENVPYGQRRNLPDLLFEAFLAALTDSYVYVHRSAVMAMGRFRLPDKFSGRVREAVWSVLLAHHRRADSYDLVCECIDQLARHLTDEERSGQVGAFLVGLLAKMPKWRLGNEIGWIGRELGSADGAINLLIALLTDPEAHEYTQERVLDAIAALPTEVVYANRATIAVMPIAQTGPGRFRVFDIVETLTRCQAWDEAEQLTISAVSATPDTLREASVRLTFELLHAAAAFENSLAEGDWDRATEMAKCWTDAKLAKEMHDRAIEQRPDPLRDL